MKSISILIALVAFLYSSTLTFTNAAAVHRSSNTRSSNTRSSNTASRCKNAFNPFSWSVQNAICLVILEQTQPRSTSTFVKDVTYGTTTATSLTTTTTTPVSTQVSTSTVSSTMTVFYDVNDLSRRNQVQLPPSLREFDIEVIRQVCLEIFYGKLPSGITQTKVSTTTQTSSIQATATITSTITSTAPVTTTATTTTTTTTSTLKALPTSSTAYCGSSQGCSCTVAGLTVTCSYTEVDATQSFTVPCPGSLAANLVGGQGGESPYTGAVINSPLVQVPATSTTPAQTTFKSGDQFSVIVGGNGKAFFRDNRNGAGGYNGGGNGAEGEGGGGSTEIDFGTQRLLVAAGSGGGSQSKLPDPNHVCNGPSGCDVNQNIGGAGGGGAPGGAITGYNGSGYAGLSLYNMGDTMNFQSSGTGPASGATLIYTCSA